LDAFSFNAIKTFSASAFAYPAVLVVEIDVSESDLGRDHEFVGIALKIIGSSASVGFAGVSALRSLSSMRCAMRHTMVSSCSV
jgi:hypothetical protein